MIKTAKNNKLLLYTLLIVTLYAALSTVGQLYFISVNESHERTYTLINQQERLALLVANIRKETGYGGFIHNFKNYLIRRDDYYAKKIEGNIVNIRATISALNNSLNSDQDREDLRSISLTFEEYFRNYLTLKELMREDKSISEMDKIVAVDDTRALDRLDSIERMINQTIIELRQKHQQSDIRTKHFSYAANILLFVCIVTGAILTLRYQRRLDEKNLEARITKEIIEKANLGIWQTDLTNKESRWSEVTANIHEVETDFKITPENSINFFKEGHSRDTIHSLFNRAIYHGEPYEAELEIITAKGNPRWILTTGIPVEVNGRINRIYGTFQDITERKKTEMRLIESSRMLNEAQVLAKIGSWHLDLASNEVIWSEELYTMYGLDPALPTPPYTEHSKFFTSESWQTLETSLARTITQGIPYELELETVRPNRSNGWIWIRGEQVCDDTGNPVAIRGVAQDITERKLVEHAIQKHSKQLEKIFDAMVDAIITIDQRGTIQNFSASAEKLFGYQAEEVIGKNVKLVMPDEYAKHHDIYISNYLRTDHAKIIGTGREVKGQKKSGEIFPIHLSISELPGEEDGVRQFIGSCHDLTQQKEQEAIIRHSQRIEAMGQLTGGVAHDFNNVLNIILGYTELLDILVAEDAKASNYTHAILEATNRASRLTSKLLQFSRHQSLKDEVTHINQLIKDNTLIFNTTFAQKVKFEIKLFPELWTTCLDKASFSDALLNLVINANHAMPNGGLIEITTLNRELDQQQASLLLLTPGDYVEVRITDNGHGIPDDIKERIFEPFFTTKGEKGSGLGLSQVYGFVKQSKGGIKVSTNMPEGTSIHLYFPRHLHHDEKSYKEIARPHVDKPHLPPVSRTILVVDDEVMLANVTRDMLSNHRYTVFTANNGEQALSILEKHECDLMISDVMLPGMKGNELANRVNQLYPKMKIQLMSGFSDISAHDIYDCALIDSMLYKPIDAQTMLNRIRELL